MFLSEEVNNQNMPHINAYFLALKKIKRNCWICFSSSATYLDDQVHLSDIVIVNIDINFHALLVQVHSLSYFR